MINFVPITHLAAIAVGDQHSQTKESSMQMIAMGMIVLASYLGGKICDRFRLSEVTGQLLGGACISPYALHLFGILPEGIGYYDNALHSFHFFIFVFLTLVAFGIGEELHFSRLKKVGKTVLVISLLEGGCTWVSITAGFHFLAHRPLLESLLIGSIGIATAPAVTFVLMNQLRIEGRLRHVLGSLVVLDDVIEVIIFSILIQLSLKAQGGTHASDSAVFPVVSDLTLALLLGAGIYLVLKTLVRRHAFSLTEEEMPQKRNEPLLKRFLAEDPSPSVEIFLLAMGSIAVGTGVAYHFHLPFLITAVFAGFLVVNYHSKVIFDSLKLENLSPVLTLLFFALIGANITLDGLKDHAWLAGMYIGLRLTGKFVGTWLGCRLMKEDAMVTSCLPRLMLPQAGVAAVEAVYAGQVLDNPLIPAIILPSIVFFEVVGVFLVDQGLRRWKRTVNQDDSQSQRTAVSGVADAARELLAYLPVSHIMLDMAFSSKREIIEGMVKHADEVSEQHFDQAQALQVLGERELLAATGVEHGIAFPHCRLMGLDRAIVVLGRHTTGLDFGGIDHEPSDLIILMLSSSRDPGEHLRLLAATAHLLGNENVRGKIRKAKTTTEVLNLLHQVAEGQ
jgi:Kef-type K+ transport system membrane component KefB/mannitol/fructose-specific phosphotransferase system IIA component (Ntr-type)